MELEFELEWAEKLAIYSTLIIDFTDTCSKLSVGYVVACHVGFNT